MDKLRAGDKVRRKDVNRDWGWNSDCKHCSIKPYDVLTVSWLQGKDLIKLDELGEYYYKKRFFEKVKEENNVAQIKKGSKVQISDKSQSKYRGKVGVVTTVWSGVWTPTKHTHYSLELLVNSKVVKTKIIAKNVELFKEASTFKVGDKVTIVKGSQYEGTHPTTNPKHDVVGVVGESTTFGKLKVIWPKGHNWYSMKDLEAAPVVTTVRKYVAASLGNKAQSSLQTYEEALEEVKRLQLANPNKVFALVEVLETAQVVVAPPVIQMTKVS